TDVEGAISVSPQNIPSERTVRALGHPCERRSTRQQMRHDGAARKAAARAIVGANPLQVVRRRGADHDAAWRCHRMAQTLLRVPARERIDVAKAEWQVDRPTELCGIEAGGSAARLDLRDAARQQACAE